MQALSRLMQAFYELNITNQLPKITAPTLIIAGEEDLIKGREYAKIISNNIPNSEFILVPGSGHALCIEKPAELNTLLLGFVMKNQSSN
jgi:3-oxoadipate enol-lactonase